jgi:Flp pilus assembly pilin Flp
MTDKLKQSKAYTFGTAREFPMQTLQERQRRFADFWNDDRGEHAIEFLMILTFGVLPLIGAVFLLQDVLREYVSFGQIFVSSPFF